MSDSVLPPHLHEFIESTPWVFAKTYAKTWPHEYIVRDRVDETLFLDLVRHIRTYGYQGSFYKKPITYFDHDSRVYWTMGGPIEETIIINRCPKEQSYEYKRDHGLLPEQQEDSRGNSDDADDETERASMPWFPIEVNNVLCTCALRFNGYEYENRVLSKNEGGAATNMPALNQPVIESLTLYVDDLKNFTVFFALQRHLFKWGGERLTKYSAKHLAFDFLFLHLYRRDVPQEFAHEGYTVRWGQIDSAQIESAAAFVRKSFIRIGNGPKCG